MSRKTKEADIDAALDIMAGTYVDYTECALVALDNPEAEYERNERLALLRSLPKEAKEVLGVIFNLPDECFSATGDLIRSRVNRMLLDHVRDRKMSLSFLNAGLKTLKCRLGFVI